MSQERNIKAVELVSKIFNMAPEDREKKLMEYNIETYLTVQEHDVTLNRMKERMDSFPCQDNGILRFFAAMSTGKRIVASITGVVLILLTIIGVSLGIVDFFKH